MKRFLPFLIIIAVAIGAGAGGFAIYKNKRTELSNIPTPQPLPGMSAAPGAKPPHTRGAKHGTVVIEEFGDFQCPPCAGIGSVLDNLQREFGEKLILVFREFPLLTHQHAMKAASAAEAAAAQGKFWEMHKLLYDNQAGWSNVADAEPMFVQYAQQIRLDTARFKADMASPVTRGRISADQTRGRTLGVSATPTLFINDERVPPPAFTEGELRRAVQAAISGKKPIFAASEKSPVPMPTATATPSASPSASP